MLAWGCCMQQHQQAWTQDSKHDRPPADEPRAQRTCRDVKAARAPGAKRGKVGADAPRQLQLAQGVVLACVLRRRQRGARGA
jgi:hypothetical protein